MDGENFGEKKSQNEYDRETSFMVEPLPSRSPEDESTAEQGTADREEYQHENQLDSGNVIDQIMDVKKTFYVLK